MSSTRAGNAATIARKSYGRLPQILEVPNLIQVQTESFRWFLEKGLAQLSDEHSLVKVVNEVVSLKENAPAVADFKKGKEQALKFLVGQVMKATKGQANPQMLNELLRRMLANGSQ